MADGSTAASREPRRKLNKQQTAKIAGALNAAGWKPVREATPDIRLQNLDPGALLAAKGGAREILATVSLGEDSLERIAEFIRKTDDPSLQSEAIDAISRSNDARAQNALVELYRSLRASTARQQILRSLRPRSENDVAAQLLFKELANTRLSRDDQASLMAPLLAMSLVRYARRSQSAPSSVLTRLPPSLQRQFATQYQLARRGSSKSFHRAAVSSKPTRSTRKPRRGITLPADVAQLIQRIRNRKNSPYHLVFQVDENGTVRLVSRTSGKRAGPSRQVLIVPTGYTVDDHELFWEDVHKMISDMGNLPEEVFTRKHRDKIVYIVRWIPGESLDSGNANFSAKIFIHPVRKNDDGTPGHGVTMHNSELIQTVKELRENSIPDLDPIGVMVVVNHEGEVTANAQPPTLLQNKFGVARITRTDIHDDMLPGEDENFEGRTWGEYVPMHELAHASLNFLDEYIEDALAGWNIRDLDYLTAAILPDDTWQGWQDAWETLIGNYDIRLSEVLADNGSGNISLRRFPATVSNDPPVYDPFEYESTGGMFFENGTRHDGGNNVMNDSRLPDGDLKPDGNRFAWSHSPAQQAVIEQVFGENRAPRPNDRLRNAGPTHDWLPQWGSSVRLLIFDADKNHNFHPTTKYEVRVGWWEWQYQGTVFDPLHGEWVWKSMTQTFTPTKRTVDLRKTFAAGGLGILRDIMVEQGVQEVQGFNLAAMTVDELLNDAIPAVIWPTPYQDVRVPLPVPNTYFWRFRTYNGTHWSGWTSFSKFNFVGSDIFG